jgi:hypothetical protein
MYVELCIVVVSIDTDSATDLSLYSVGNRVLLPGMKWPGCEANNFM